MMITMILLMMIMIFPTNRRDIFLLYYVKERMHSWRWSSQDRTYDTYTFPIHSICASRDTAGDLPLILLLLPGEYTAFLACVMKTSRCRNTVYIYLRIIFSSFLSSPSRLAFPFVRLFFVPTITPFPFDLYRILSRVTQTQSYYIILFGDIFIQ